MAVLSDFSSSSFLGPIWNATLTFKFLDGLEIQWLLAQNILSVKIGKGVGNETILEELAVP